jgi:hypothetical protein
MPDKKQISKRRKNNWPKGKSGNPAGAPKRGESWAELFASIGNLTGEEAAERTIKLWAGKFRSLPKGVTLKELVVLRAFAALLDESNARLLKEVMDRAEGKVAEHVDLTSGGQPILRRVGVDVDEV